uniref:T9SS type A sorting domain-containing protein n=1 Tax=Ignavibacterium album TaxID=591197 RepID=A0A832DIH5_9BACT
MKNKTITTLLIILLSMLTYAQNTYNVQPGVKNNQIVLELSNNSITETVQIKSLPNTSKGGAYERIKLTNQKEKFVELLPEETKEIVYTFDVDYNIGTTKSDTIEFTITDGNAINITKQFILQYTIPAEYKLEQNYPNPFNPTTKIKYSIPSVILSSSKDDKGGVTLRRAQSDNKVTLKVYDILGNEIVTLVDEQKEAGYYEVEFSTGSFGDATQLASGVYFYRLQAGNFIQTKKMLLLR